MTNALRFIRKLAFANMLANDRLHEAVSALKPGEFEAPRTGFFPSLVATLNHILIIDWFYIDALEGGDLGPRAWQNAVPYSDAAELRAAQLASDRRLLTLCRKLGDEDLGRPTRVHRTGRIQVERTDDVLSHLFQHQTHHRGQAHAMLSGTSVKPPQLDEFIVADDAASRVDVMERLGLTEADVMDLDR
ncbi:DinB family protein [Rhizobium glycinendophyticum]|uniref:Damage-inducible protein DinB n=1 Tax=Rhizobium glycinendophyticum TaxID=2589807 RepID=A0A504U9L2_9HYPH|nr:DinB family protein [Rhizobium glycinendophyticum]TPP11918.1 damage-inducible protein DinB [Rhizobium glycinendophyticum]